MKIKEILNAVKTVKEVNKFVKQQEDAKTKVRQYVERIETVKQVFLSALCRLNSLLDKLKGIDKD